MSMMKAITSRGPQKAQRNPSVAMCSGVDGVDDDGDAGQHG